jgi:hypothetical protein
MIAHENKMAVGEEEPGSATKINNSYEQEKLYSELHISLNIMNHEFMPQ